MAELSLVLAIPIHIPMNTNILVCLILLIIKYPVYVFYINFKLQVSYYIQEIIMTASTVRWLYLTMNHTKIVSNLFYFTHRRHILLQSVDIYIFMVISRKWQFVCSTAAMELISQNNIQKQTNPVKKHLKVFLLDE